jgi:hypothetical protein
MRGCSELNSGLDRQSELQDEERCWEDENSWEGKKGSERGQRILLQIERVRLEPEEALFLSKEISGLGLLQLDIAPPMPAASGGWGFGRGS